MARQHNGIEATRIGGILILIALIDLLEYAAGTQWPVLIGQRDIDFLFRIQVPLTAVNIALSMLLVGFTDTGITGVLIATLVVAAIRRPLVLWHTATRCNVRIPAYLSFSYVPALVVMTLLLLLVGVLHAFIPSHSWVWLTVHAVLLATAWLPLTLVFGMTAEERVLLAQLVRRMTAFAVGS